MNCKTHVFCTKVNVRREMELLVGVIFQAMIRPFLAKFAKNSVFQKTLLPFLETAASAAGFSAAKKRLRRRRICAFGAFWADPEGIKWPILGLLGLK